MNKSLLSRRYALAFYDYALEKGKDREVRDFFNVFIENWGAMPLLRSAMADPTLPSDKKLELLELACGSRENATLHKLLSFLIDKGREQFMGRIAKSYVEIWDKKNNILRGNLITVREPSDHLAQSLTEILQKIIPGKRIRLKMEEDEELVGGFILQLDSLRVDASIATELRYLKNSLLKE